MLKRTEIELDVLYAGEINETSAHSMLDWLLQAEEKLPLDFKLGICMNRKISVPKFKTKSRHILQVHGSDAYLRTLIILKNRSTELARFGFSNYSELKACANGAVASTNTSTCQKDPLTVYIADEASRRIDIVGKFLASLKILTSLLLPI